MKFCGGCGAAVVNRPGLQDSVTTASYMPQPVATLAPPGTAAAEIKQVTVLVCDIVDSAPLTERLGPEAMRDLVATLARQARELGLRRATTRRLTGLHR
jgi:class 3 adenylate cyclase